MHEGGGLGNWGKIDPNTGETIPEIGYVKVVYRCRCRVPVPEAEGPITGGDQEEKQKKKKDSEKEDKDD